MYAGKVKSATPEDVAMLLDGAQRVIVVPGYGLAVAQAQHTVRELATLLEERGTTVEYAIHPVAGRMPGHMNVLLAEADVPYDQLKEMDEINPTFAQCDVAIVIGANDVVNPLANTDPTSPIAGHADSQRRQGPQRGRREAEPEPRLRGHPQPAVRGGQLPDALRRRQEGAGRAGGGDEGSVRSLSQRQQDAETQRRMDIRPFRLCAFAPLREIF